MLEDFFLSLDGIEFMMMEIVGFLNYNAKCDVMSNNNKIFKKWIHW